MGKHPTTFDTVYYDDFPSHWNTLKSSKVDELSIDALSWNNLKCPHTTNNYKNYNLVCLLG